MSDFEQIPLSEELLGVMRRAADIALSAGEPFVTPRSMLLSLLDDPQVGPAISHVVVREKLAALEPAAAETSGLSRIADTIAFKTAGKSNVWLTKDALSIFLEGAERAREGYAPKHLALGFAAEALRAPGVLAAIRVEPGALREAVYRL